MGPARFSSVVSGALRWLLLPWWLAQVFSEEKSFHPNPILGSRRLNKSGLYVWRARLAHRLTQARRRRLEPLVSAAERAAFERDGYVAKRNFLRPGQFEALVKEVEGFAAEAGEFKEGDAITRRIPLNRENLNRLPACRELLSQPAWRGLTRYVSSFDADPLVFIQTIFTKVDEGRTDPQTSMHIDTFHPTMKAWLFLHDVEEEDGPFSYVPGSHRRTPRREVWERRKSIEGSDPNTQKKGGSFRIDKHGLAKLRAGKPKRFAVPANTLVVGDTSGFHARRPSLQPTARVEIWAYSRRNPFTPWTRMDLASTPLLNGNAARLGWWFMQVRQRLGLPAPQFRVVAGVTAETPPAPWAL